jgi:CarboxypepD_reg-like domain/Secretion system C-terminal sorting domain
MGKKIQLQIAEPCHENWDAMTPVEQGKFCGSCQKQVVDFTDMSDRQIAEFFKKPATGSVCGRFMNDQLERDIEIPKKRIPWVKYFFSIALPAFFLSKASAQKMGKPQFKADKDTIAQPVLTDRIMLGMVVPERIVPAEDKKVVVENVNALKIWVVDAETGIPVEGAAISLNTSIGKEIITAGINGGALLNINRKHTFHGITISYPGYTTRTISYGEFKKGTDGRIVFKLEKMLPVREELMIKGQVDRVPVCNISMGAVMYGLDIKPVVKVAENKIVGAVVSENNEPVPFASIVGGKKGEGVMADENGEFVIDKDWLKKGRSLQVSSVGYEPAVVKAGEESYRDAALYVQLKLKSMLEEVVVTDNRIICTRNLIMGNATISKGEVLVVDKKENKTNPETNRVMDKPHLQVYPNPVAAGGAVSLSFKNPEEGYYQLQIISAAGQLVKQQEIWLDAEAGLLHIDIPGVTTGTYFMVLANKKNGRKYAEKIIVQ